MHASPRSALSSVRSLPRKQIWELLEVQHTAALFDQLQKFTFEL